MEPGRSLLPGPVSSRGALAGGVPGLRARLSPPRGGSSSPQLSTPFAIALASPATLCISPWALCLGSSARMSASVCSAGIKAPFPGLNLSVKYVTSWITSLPWSPSSHWARGTNFPIWFVLVIYRLLGSLLQVTWKSLHDFSLWLWYCAHQNVLNWC